MVMKNVLFILTFLLLLSCSVDKDYSLKKDINYEVNVGKQVQVPLGNLGTLRIRDLIFESAKAYFYNNEEKDWIFDPQGQILTNFQFGGYKLAGLAFLHIKNYNLPEIRFYMDITNTLPFDFKLDCYVTDSTGNKMPNVDSFITASIPAGTEEEPGETFAVLRIAKTQLSSEQSIDGFCLTLTSPQMPGGAMLLSRKLGIGLKRVSVQLPEGVNVNIKKKKKTSEDDE